MPARSKTPLINALVAVAALVGVILVWLDGRELEADWERIERDPAPAAAAVEVELPMTAPPASDSERAAPRVEADPDTAQKEHASAPRAAAQQASNPATPAAPAEWTVSYRFVDEAGQKLTLQSFQEAGIARLGLVLRYRTHDGTTGLGVRVPEIDDSMRIADGALRGAGEFPVSLVLTHGDVEVGRGVATGPDLRVDVPVDLRQVAMDCYRVSFQLQRGCFARIDIRGAGRLESYVPATQPTYATLDGRPGHPGEQELTIGLPVGEYHYEALLYDAASESRASAKGQFEVDLRDQVIELSLHATGSLQGSVSGDAGSSPLIQILPEQGEPVDASRLIARVREGRYRVDDLPAGPYRIVVYELDKSTLTLSFRFAESVEVVAGEVTERDLVPGGENRALREWTLRSETQGFSLSIIDVGPDGERRTLLDMPQAGPGVRIALPREARLEFIAAPIVRDEDSIGADFSASVTGVPRGDDEIWFDFRAGSDG